MAETTPLSLFLWVAYPYAVAAVFVVGTALRYRYDQFGWTSRSSQVYERRILAVASPLFHIGVLMVIGGHVVGLLIPREWLYAIGVSEHIYHLGATWMGTAAAAATVIGLALLIYRRIRYTAVRRATTRMDKIMFTLLGATLAFGTAATVMHQLLGAGYEYRGTISPWLRSLIVLHPNPSLMADVPVAFQLHVLTALALLGIWPFTRLVHVFSAPVGYLRRPYIVYRSRDAQRGARRQHRGWPGATTDSPPHRARR